MSKRFVTVKPSFTAQTSGPAAARAATAPATRRMGVPIRYGAAME
jgi:hypothetical protein